MSNPPGGSHSRFGPAWVLLRNAYKMYASKFAGEDWKPGRMPAGQSGNVFGAEDDATATLSRKLYRYMWDAETNNRVSIVRGDMMLMCAHQKRDKQGPARNRPT